MRFRRPPLVDPRCVVTGPPLKTAFIMFQRDPHACKQWQNQLEEKKRAAADYSTRDESMCCRLITARVCTALNSIFSREEGGLQKELIWEDYLLY